LSICPAIPDISFLAKVVDYFHGVERYQTLCTFNLDVGKHIIEFRTEHLGSKSSAGSTIADRIYPESKETPAG
jgi:hypothetical protein